MKHMGRLVKDQINFNTVLLLIIGALITFAIKKADESYLMLLQHDSRIRTVEHRVDVIETKL